MKRFTLHKRRFGRLAGFGALMVVGSALLGCPPSGQVVFIDDYGLELAIRDELNQPLGMLTSSALLELRTLDAKGRGISDLTGLEYCVNLTWLDLDTNAVSDITPLSNLSNLMVVNLDGNEVFDVSPMAGLLNLDSVSLFDNQVADIQALVTNATNGGLGPGDSVILDVRALSLEALTVDVPELEARGVDVILATAADESD